MITKKFKKGCCKMFWAIGIIGIVVGLTFMLISKDKWRSLFRQANEAKGREVYSEENIEKRIKLIKIIAPIALVAGGLLIIMEITGF